MTQAQIELPSDVEKRLRKAMKLINLSGYGPELNDISANPDDILVAVAYELALQAQEHTESVSQAVKKEQERAITTLDDIYDYGMGREEMIEIFTKKLLQKKDAKPTHLDNLLHSPGETVSLGELGKAITEDEEK